MFHRRRRRSSERPRPGPDSDLDPGDLEPCPDPDTDPSLWGNLVVRRQPLIPCILSVSDAAAIARKPFKPPCGNGYSENSELLARRLSARKRFVPWGSVQPFAVPNNLQQLPTIASDDSQRKRNLFHLA
ncbi:putative DNA repair and recombination RAD54-like protein [Hordeum vulgare]|nr:putative DNA repair and recombination RAD54-like protein [Hordeum vulgare]